MTYILAAITRDQTADRTPLTADPIALARSLPAPSLDARSRYLRRLTVDALIGGERGHIGSTMSLIEILRVLYDSVLSYRPDKPDWPARDRCVLSKGHGCLALYALLADKGFFDTAALTDFCRHHSFLGGHPERGKVPGVEASTGALGHGLSLGVGMALAQRMRGRAARVFVIMGDGEINEGSVWGGDGRPNTGSTTSSRLSITTKSNRPGRPR